MAADAYARVSGGLGCAIATSGPGATNLVTGISCAWFDSVPVLYLTGQVARFRFKRDTGVRQMGFQETDIVNMVRPITKYAVLVTEKSDLRFELEKAVYIAREGRPGPVLVDVPDDLQREVIDPRKLRSFSPEPTEGLMLVKRRPSADQVEQCLTLVRGARRPVLILGFGVRLSGASKLVPDLLERLGMPVCPSWAAADLIPGDHPLLVGTFGTHGTRAGNFAVQNADLILSIGARLSTRETGSPLSWWARDAHTVIVDIDPAELAKFSAFDKRPDLPIHSDANAFIEDLLAGLTDQKRPACDEWVARINDWKARYPVCNPAYHREEQANPYVFVEALSRQLLPDDIIVVDTGCAVAWMMQGFRFKSGQRLLHAFNNTPMGYALPGAVGAAFATGKSRRIICITGDGSLMMNIQELATVSHHRLPVKMFVINNGGYSMVQQTQEQWLGGKYYASSRGSEGGLSFPDFQLMARSCGFATTEIVTNKGIDGGIGDSLRLEGPVLCDVRVPASSRVVPQCKFGYPIEDSEPLLPRDEFFSNMIVRPLPVSLDGPS